MEADYKIVSELFLVLEIILVVFIPNFGTNRLVTVAQRCVGYRKPLSDDLR